MLRARAMVAFPVVLALTSGCPTRALPPSERAEDSAAVSPTIVGAAEPPLPAGAIRRLGSGLVPSWDPARVIGFACDGACYVTAGRTLAAKWDSESGRLLQVVQTGLDAEPNAELQIVDGELRVVDETGCLRSGDQEIGCLPETIDPASLGCVIDPARIQRDIEKCEENEYCDSPPYDIEAPLQRWTAAAAATAPRILATFQCFGEDEYRLGLFDVADDRRLALAALAPTGTPHRRRGHAVAIAADGRRVAFLDEPGWVVVDIDEDRELWTLPKDAGFGRASFSDDGTHLAVVDGMKVTVVSIDDRHVVYRSPKVKPTCYDPAESSYRRDAFVEFLDPQRLLVYLADGRLRIVATNTGEVAFETEVCATTALTDDAETLLVVGTREATEPLRFRLPSPQPLPRPLAEAPPRNAQAVAISADGRIAASMVSAEVAWAWEVTTGKLLHRLELRSGGVQIRPLVTLSPDGSRLASSHQIGALWDMESGKNLGLLDTTFHSFSTDRFMFSPDGALLTAVTEENLRLWDADDGRLLHEIVIPGASVYDAVFIDGTRLVVADQKRVHLIDAAVGKLIHSTDLPARCPDECSKHERPRLHAIDPRELVVDGRPRGFARIEVGVDRLTVRSTDPLPTPAPAPHEPSAAAPAAKLGVTRDPSSTALLVWPHPWPAGS